MNVLQWYQSEIAGCREHQRSLCVQALQVLYSEREVGGEVGLPRHWMRDFFLASLCLEVQENQEALSRLQVCIMYLNFCISSEVHVMVHVCMWMH